MTFLVTYSLLVELRSLIHYLSTIIPCLNMHRVNLYQQATYMMCYENGYLKTGCSLYLTAVKSGHLISQPVTDSV